MSRTSREDRRAIHSSIDGGYQYRAATEGPRIQRYWHGLKLRYIGRFCLPEAGDEVLDIGCGSGVVANFLADNAKSATGIDFSAEAIEFAKSTFAKPNLKFIEAAVQELAFDSESLDRVYCMELIEHILKEEGEKLLARCHEILRPGGRILVTTPNYRGLWPMVEAVLDTMGLTPRMRGEQHVTRYHRGSLRAALEGAGFTIRELRTFSTFAPFLAYIPKLPHMVDAVECRLDLPFGNILLAVGEK